MRAFLLSFMLLSGSYCNAQSLVVTAADTSSERIKTAIHFLERYLSSFKKKKTPDYTQFWSKADCKRSLLPDNMVYTVGFPKLRRFRSRVNL